MRSVIVCLTALALFAVPSVASAHDSSGEALVFFRPWIAEPPPGLPTAAAYVEIANEGSEPDRLVAVEAAFAERVELHAVTLNDQGVMEMRELEGGMALEPGGHLTLEPGGYHIMFFGVTAPLVAGDHHAIRLTFDHLGVYDIMFVVEKRSAMGMDDGMDHMSHGDDMADDTSMDMDHDGMAMESEMETGVMEEDAMNHGDQE